MPENQNIEYKETWRDEFLKWICGFANLDGGVLYIGIKDNGEVIGVNDAKKLLDNIPNKILSHLGLISDVRLEVKEGKNIISIRIEPYPYPISYQGKYYIRSGSTNQELKGAALDRFLLLKAGKRWDGVPVPNVKVSDLNESSLQLFRKKATASNRVDEEVLNDSNAVLIENLNLFDNKLLKRAALLLFHDMPEKFFPGTYLKIGYFKADDELIFQDEIHGSLLEQIERSWELLTTKYSEGLISYDEISRSEKSTIPRPALREALLNAIAHKNYSQTSPIQISVYKDHLVIWNEGQLPENWTTESLRKKHPSKPFNPDIANTLFRSGYIESWGRGTIKMMNECVKGGILPPDLNTQYSGFMVTFYNDAEIYLKARNTPKPLIDIVLYALTGNQVSNSAVKSICKVSKATATRYLQQLEGEFLEKIGETGKGTFYMIKGLTKGS